MYTHKLIASPFKPSVGSAAAGNTALNGQEMALVELQLQREKERKTSKEVQKEQKSTQCVFNYCFRSCVTSLGPKA